MKYRLGDICTITKGATGIMKAIPGPYTMIALGEVDKTHNEYQFDARAVVIPLVSSTGHGHASMKRVKYFEGKFALGNILCAVIPNDERFVLAKYLHIYLHWNREELLVSQMKGMANVSLPMNRIADVMVTIPSIEKQIEIVELEKKLVEKELEADKLFANQLTLIENLNQAILQEAVQGKLVPQDPKDEPAGELLKRIKAEKAKSGKKEKPLPPIKPEEIPFEIPGNWVWCRLGEICEVIGGFAFDSTRYSKIETNNQVIRLGNVKPNQLVLETSPVFIDDEYAAEVEKSILKENDILITMTGTKAKRDYLFSLCLKPNDLATKNLYLNQRVGCFRFNELLLPDFINFALEDLALLNPVFESSTGAANQANIGMTALKEILIPLPPLPEQNRIIFEIEKQLAKTKQLKEHIIANQQATEQLLKALLHQAFEPGQKVDKEKKTQEL